MNANGWATIVAIGMMGGVPCFMIFATLLRWHREDKAREQEEDGHV